MQLRQHLRHASRPFREGARRKWLPAVGGTTHLLHYVGRQHLRSLATQAAEVAAEPTTSKPVKEGWWTKSTPNMRDVNSIQELVDQLADAGDKLVVVEFFAPWCNACKALYPKVCQLMGEHPDDVLCLKINLEANKDMCKTLGVKVLPYFHLYRGAEGRVTSFSCTLSKIQRLRDALELYTAAFCSLEEPPGVAEFPEVHAHAADAGSGKVELRPVADHDQPTRLRAWM